MHFIVSRSPGYESNQHTFQAYNLTANPNQRPVLVSYTTRTVPSHRKK